MITHYPIWSQECAKKYLSRTLNTFLIHGNVHDLVSIGSEESAPQFLRLHEFLADEFFGARDIVLFYNRASGVYFRDKASREDFEQALQARDSLLGTSYAKSLPKDPVRIFSILESYFRLRLGQNKSVALITEHAETIVPMNDAGSTGVEDRNALVYITRWAQDPVLLGGDFSHIILTENLNDLNRTLIQHPYTSEISIPHPDASARRRYLESKIPEDEYAKVFELPIHVLAQQTAGLTILQLQSLYFNAKENKEPLNLDTITQTKKELIEAEAYGLLEFVESAFSLKDVAGHRLVKEHLQLTAKALKEGNPEVLPMGYLVCGPVGTGKTFLVQCFAKDVGIPMVKLKNFRSQWQGVTEGNLEKILHLLEAMAPVAVMIDEADAYLGDRSASGDSGVSSRVFSQIASFMSNTEHRGRIIWFLMTARPDLMPIDLKRQGRAEEHLALFPPQNSEEKEELFRAMAKKTKIKLEVEVVPELLLSDSYHLSGADMEAVLTRAKFEAVAHGKESVDLAMLEQVIQNFIPPTYPEEVELQTLLAVLECTSKKLLPDVYTQMDRQELLSRIEELRFRIA
jgi:SpoVK/Ycf46/Vps4 family AAA+-type ATPase